MSAIDGSAAEAAAATATAATNTAEAAAAATAAAAAAAAAAAKAKAKASLSVAIRAGAAEDNSSDDDSDDSDDDSGIVAPKLVTQQAAMPMVNADAALCLFEEGANSSTSNSKISSTSSSNGGDNDDDVDIAADCCLSDDSDCDYSEDSKENKSSNKALLSPDLGGPNVFAVSTTTTTSTAEAGNNTTTPLVVKPRRKRACLFFFLLKRYVLHHNAVNALGCLALSLPVAARLLLPRAKKSTRLLLVELMALEAKCGADATISYHYFEFLFTALLRVIFLEIAGTNNTLEKRELSALGGALLGKKTKGGVTHCTRKQREKNIALQKVVWSLCAVLLLSFLFPSLFAHTTTTTIPVRPCLPKLTPTRTSHCRPTSLCRT
jgi:hypothetical protein